MASLRVQTHTLWKMLVGLEWICLFVNGSREKSFGRHAFDESNAASMVVCLLSYVWVRYKG